MSKWNDQWGPTLGISKWVYDTKYFPDETFKEGITRVANGLKDSDEHFTALRVVLGRQMFLPGGRILNSIGSPRVTTPNNCYVMAKIPDSMEGIMRVAAEAAETMRRGGGVGYDFSTLRPRGALIKTLDSQSSGPLSFMEVYDAICACISSAGHRRGAQMGVLRVDHPDIEQFVEAKCNHHRLTNFNISVAVTDEFMQAVKDDAMFALRFDGTVYREVRATALWDKILRATWDWAEPGVLFIDRINKKNNLWYCEEIAATNPCGEQPLPPHGACLLGSFNLTKFIVPVEKDRYGFDLASFKAVLPTVVRAMDNVIDHGPYPLAEQKEIHEATRRMGLGVTGLANTSEIMGMGYGTEKMLQFTAHILQVLRDECYIASIQLAKEKGAFPLFEAAKYIRSEFANTLPEHIIAGIQNHGIRNSHLLSIAPTGTISLGADNISSGIEPVFSLGYDRDVRTFDGVRTERVDDYAYRVYNVKGRTVDDISVEDHVKVLNVASHYVDSSVSKTCNVGDNVTWEEFKNVYMSAYDGGASGCTTFRASGERFGMMRKSSEEDTQDVEQKDETIIEGSACYIDPETGIKTCE